MVSGSLCPLISFLDVSFSVSFVVRGQRPRRGRWPMASPHREIFSIFLVWWESKKGPQSQLRGPQNQLRGPQSQLRGPQTQLGGPRGGDGRTETRKTRTRKTRTEKISLCGDAIGHRPLRGRCPKGLYFKELVMMLIIIIAYYTTRHHPRSTSYIKSIPLRGGILGAVAVKHLNLSYISV